MRLWNSKSTYKDNVLRKMQSSISCLFFYYNTRIFITILLFVLRHFLPVGELKQLFSSLYKKLKMTNIMETQKCYGLNFTFL